VGTENVSIVTIIYRVRKSPPDIENLAELGKCWFQWVVFNIIIDGENIVLEIRFLQERIFIGKFFSNSIGIYPQASCR